MRVVKMYKVNPNKIRKEKIAARNIADSVKTPKGKQPRFNGKPLQCKECTQHTFTAFTKNDYECDNCGTLYSVQDS